jgi:Na+(H+)/acetate symporter ActP
VLVLMKFGWNPLTLFQQADEGTNARTPRPKPVRQSLPSSRRPRRPPRSRSGTSSRMILGVTLGVLGLPHVMIRFLTVRNSNCRGPHLGRDGDLDLRRLPHHAAGPRLSAR